MTKLRWNNPPRESDPANFVKDATCVKPIDRRVSGGKKFNNLQLAFKEFKQSEKQLGKLKKKFSQLKAEETKLLKKLSKKIDEKSDMQLFLIRQHKENLNEEISKQSLKCSELRAKAASFI